MKFRTDIQALRAVAVGLVVLFHLDECILPGGFIGVDVFFVISGFLITQSLLTEHSRTKSISFLGFWARRARRLLPAALTVIVFSVLSLYALYPPFARSESIWDAIAATFYFENWRLAATATDYFAATSPSVFQHYWSLAVEEQFYLVWPLFLYVVLSVSRVRAAVFVIGAVAFLSFGYSLILSFTGDPSSYFSTFGRVWEFGLGALVAARHFTGGKVLPSRYSVLGFGLIVGSGLFLSSEVTFPGFWALIPTLGAALVTASRPRGIAAKVTQNRIFQWLGDQSYGIYLWHWPIVIFAPLLVGELTKPWQLLVALTATLLLAALGKLLIEDPIRKQSFDFLKQSGRSMGVALASSAVVLVVIAAVGFETEKQITSVRQQTVKAEAASCFGALSLARESCFGVDSSLVSTYDQATHDSADPDNACMTKPDSSRLIVCSHGPNPNSSKRVLLVGDSHAAMYFGALKVAAKDRNWHITLLYKASCAFNLAPRNDTQRGKTCSEWNDKIQGWLKTQKPFDYVFTSYMASNISTDLDTPDYPEQFKRGFYMAWKPLTDSGSKILVIKDGPKMTKSMADCFGDPLQARTCSMSRSEGVPDDVAFELAGNHENVEALDLTDLICSEVCRSVEGGLFVYRDSHHLSLEYAKSMTKPLLERFDQLVSAREQRD